MLQEIINEENAYGQFTYNLRLLTNRYSLPSGLSVHQKILRLTRRVDRKELEALYVHLSSRLNRRFEQEANRTYYEYIFGVHLKANTKLKYYPQTWIGNFCVDLFIPGLGVANSGFLRGYCFKGIAIEIDGPCHNLELKMKKDWSKQRSLEAIGVLSVHIENDQVRKVGLPIPSSDARIRPLCSRDRERLWRRIQLITILYHCQPELVAGLFEAANDAANNRRVYQ